MVKWQRDENDPNSQFVLRKIKLDCSQGPTVESTPVPIMNSQNNQGMSQMVFNKAGSKYVYLRPISSFRFKGTNRDMMYNPLSSKASLVTVTITSSTSSATAPDDSTKMTTPAKSNVEPTNGTDTAAIIGSIILPPIPAARPVSSSEPDSATSTSSIRRARDTERKTPSISLSNLSSSNGSTGTGSLFPIPVLPPRPRTDRQMSIEEEIQQLQARMLFLQGNGNTSPIGLEKEEELKKIYRKVETLKKLHESKWALGLTNEMSL
ncbi:hypothetical protein HHX47_DHR3000340 [Lentinula edodes]|nr:hypothetical protein HHX47_DHR3000340 [Lentinula edodes]